MAPTLDRDELRYRHHYDRLTQTLNFTGVWIALLGTLEKQAEADVS